MYVHSDVLNQIIVHFEIVDYFKFCEKYSYESSFNELDEVNIQYRKYQCLLVHDILLNYKSESLSVLIEDIFGFSRSFRCTPKTHTKFSCDCQLLEYFEVCVPGLHQGEVTVPSTFT